MTKSNMKSIIEYAIESVPPYMCVPLLVIWLIGSVVLGGWVIPFLISANDTVLVICGTLLIFVVVFGLIASCIPCVYYYLKIFKEDKDL